MTRHTPTPEFACPPTGDKADGATSSLPAPSATDEAFNRGYERGYDWGYERGYDLAYDQGYDLGVTHGRAEALQEVRKGEIDPFADDTGMVML